jgi:hypothetical protein
MLRASDELIRIRHRLDGVLCRLERVLRNEHFRRHVLERVGLVVIRALELRLDPGRAQDRLDLLRLGEILREC